ncbi:MAG TPA: hypothetical protein VFW16_14005 [Streptosporangiaceae bacterium]|nr:hypothetical protein [Streptosporangiaceae bacterium]
MESPSVVFGVSTQGMTVAEALIDDLAEARGLLAAARRAGSELAWAHSAADLSELGFREQPGYRKMTGPIAIGAPDSVVPLPPGEDSPELWAAAFRGQWGHKTPQPDQWPFDLPAGTVTLCVRKDGGIAGVCRVDPASGLIDAPGVLPAHRGDLAGYEALLRSAAALVDAPVVAVESWGEGPERVAVCERLGLTTADYTAGWEFVLHQ